MGIALIMPEADSPVNRFELQHLLELLNSSEAGADEQLLDTYVQEPQDLPETATAAPAHPQPLSAGVENRFVAHISQAMSKTKSTSLVLSESSAVPA